LFDSSTTCPSVDTVRDATSGNALNIETMYARARAFGDGVFFGGRTFVLVAPFAEFHFLNSNWPKTSKDESGLSRYLHLLTDQNQGHLSSSASRDLLSSSSSIVTHMPKKPVKFFFSCTQREVSMT
jgi:hypothetical protein